MDKIIPVNTPLFQGNELEYVTDCIRTGWVSSEGQYIQKFEDAFCKSINRAFGVAVSSGSAALDIAVKALDIVKGDEVIAPAFTIISPVQSIVNVGAIPVLVDIDPHTWNMNADLIAAKISPKTKAILVVHIYGLPVDLDPIIALCKKHNLKLIEDAAEMHGQTYNGQPCGSFGDISTFSFYSNKHITTGEGGMLVCNDKQLAERCKRLRNLAFDPRLRRFVHEEIGWNYRMTNMQAALGLAQTEQINKVVLQKKELGKYYQQQLKNLENKGYLLPLPITNFAENIYWVFGIIAPDEERNLAITKYLAQQNIGTRPFFWCMHEQPVFNKMGLFLNEKHPHAEAIARRGFYIPSGVGLTLEEAKYVADTLLKGAEIIEEEFLNTN